MDVYKIGNRMKQARALRNYTLDNIANEIGVAKSTIQRYENGLITKPKLPVLQAIADSLNINPAWLSGQEVPMTIDDSLNTIIDNRLKDLNMSLEDVAERSGIPLRWLQNTERIIPDDHDYVWASKLAQAIRLPGSILRSALARQEPPIPDNLPRISAEEAFKQAQEDFKEPFEEDNIKSLISKDEQRHLHKYRTIDGKGRHTVDTILEMEYNRCKSAEETIVITNNIEDKSYLEPLAAHHRTDINKEEITEEMKQHDMDIMDDPDF